MRRRWAIAIIGIIFVSTFAGTCSSSGSSKKGGKTAAAEQSSVQTGFNRLSNSQPIPQFDWSQERQTLIDVETARAQGAITTTAGMLEGVGLVWWCPSIGAPVPSTFQLSGSQQYVDLPGDQDRQLYAIDQGEPTGVYVGPSSGTWTICLDDAGKKFAVYWEGYVKSTVGKVDGLPGEKREKIGQSTFTFTEKPK